MNESTGRNNHKRTFRLVRWLVLLAVLAASTVIGLLHQRAPELRLVGVDALCPFGGIESLWAVVSGGDMLKRIAVGSFVLLGASIGLNLLFGRSFCGQFCPLGTLQELFGSLRNKLKAPRLEVPVAVDIPARFLKYLVLGVFAWLSWLTGSLIIRPYDPWVAYHHLTSPELFTAFGIGAAVLAVSLAGSFLYDRFFCKYLCPMGALLGLFNKVSFFRIQRDAEVCIDCGACDRVCPANIAVSRVEATVSDSECIVCGECVAACPKEPALRLRSRSGSVITPLHLTVATAAIIAGVIAASMVFGDMRIAMPALAQQVAPASPVQGQAPVDVSLIKGYMSMNEVAQAAGIPPQAFAAQFGVTEAELGLPIKEVKANYAWDTQAVRDWVADQTGSPRAAGDSCE